jgi:hypothetical protein
VIVTSPADVLSVAVFASAGSLDGADAGFAGVPEAGYEHVPLCVTVELALSLVLVLVLALAAGFAAGAEFVEHAARPVSSTATTGRTRRRLRM